MMPREGTARKQRFFTQVAGDAFLFSAALFAIPMGLIGLVVWLVPGLSGPEGPAGVAGAVVSGLSSILGIAGVVAGAVIAWKMHGRDFSSTSIAGIALGVVLGSIATGVAIFGFIGIAMLIGRLIGEVPGLIFAVAILAIVCIVAIIRLDSDAIRDMASERSEHRRLDALRLSATAVLIVLAGVVATLVTRYPTQEYGEAILFAIMAGAQAAIITAIADWWVRRTEARLHEEGSALTT